MLNTGSDNIISVTIFAITLFIQVKVVVKKYTLILESIFFLQQGSLFSVDFCPLTTYLV